MKKKIIVTGGCGFIGSHFIKLFKNKYQIINVDKMTYASRTVHNDVENHKYDICNKAYMDDLFQYNKDAIAVINFAAETHVDNSISDSDPFVQTNIQGTKVILDLVRKYDMRKMIQISTDEVYGHIEQCGEVKAFKEEDELRPRNPYSASKAAADMMCLAYHNTYMTPVIITRTCNNYGIAQHEEKMLPKFCKQMSNNQGMTLYGSGGQMREWIWVEDNCRAIHLALEKGKEGEVYNIGSGNDYTNIEIATMIAEIFDKKDGYLRHLPDRPGHDFRYKVDYSKIRELGFTEQADFNEKFKQVVEWYRNTYDLVNKIRRES